MGKGFSVVFENDGQGLLFTGRGVLSGEQMIENTPTTYSPEVLQRLRYQIVDLRGVERMDISCEQMQHLAQMDRSAAQANAAMRVAIVAAHDITIALGRIYSAYAQSPKLETRVFTTMEEARTWVRDASSGDSPKANAR